MNEAYGLVLGGGGAKGAFEIGVWKALKECNIKINAAIGTSVGALNAAVIAQNDFDKAYSFWTNLTINQVLDLKETVNKNYQEKWSYQSFETFRSGFLNLLFSGGLDISPLRHNLESLISEEKIRHSPIRFGLVTVDLSSLSPKELMIEDIPKGQLLDYLLASAALPIFQKQEIDGNTFLDGGFFDKLPINFMINQGFRNIISVELPAPGIKRPIFDKNVKIINITNSQIRGGMLDFNEKTIKPNIDLGYLESMKTLGYYLGRQYYFDFSQRNSVYSLFSKEVGYPIKPERLNSKMRALLSIQSSDKTILNALYELKNRTSYKKDDLYLSMLEITGNNLGLDKFQSYHPDVFILNLLNRLHQLLLENKVLLETSDIINELTRPDSNYAFSHFSMLYFVFLMLRNDLPVERMAWFTHYFTPEMIISSVTLLYIHTSIRKYHQKK